MHVFAAELDGSWSNAANIGAWVNRTGWSNASKVGDDEGRDSLGVGVLNGKLYAVGGYTFSSGYHTLASVEVFWKVISQNSRKPDL